MIEVFILLYFISVTLCALSILLIPKEKLYRIYKKPGEIVFIALFPVLNIIALVYHIKISRK
jgi:hypothetical protein